MSRQLTLPFKAPAWRCRRCGFVRHDDPHPRPGGVPWVLMCLITCGSTYWEPLS